MRPTHRITMSLALLIVLSVAALPARAQVPKPLEGVALTVYNGGYAVVREHRNLEIGRDGLVKFRDVPTAIDATTVHFKSFTDPAAKLLEQNYQFDLVSADKLLQKYIDKPIEVRAEGRDYAGTLLSFDQSQLVLQDAEGGILMVTRPQHVRDIRFGKLPEGLLTQPTLLWQVATEKPGTQACEVTYQTYGMSWHAEYVMVLNGDDTRGDLSGWVSVQNNSGKAYASAEMKFIAGDVRRVQPGMPGPVGGQSGQQGQSQGGMTEKAFFEYHLYTLGRPSTVANNEIKQLELFEPARDFAVEKKFLYYPLGQYRWHWYYGNRYTDQSYGTQNPSKKVGVYIDFKNTRDNKLGLPLPAGKIRVYKKDPADGAMEFIGEEQIDHTPRNEQLSLQIGNAFDLVGERKQTDFKTRSNWIEETVEIRLRNQKETGDVVIRVKEPMYRWSNWRITAQSHPHEKLDAFHAVWDVKVPAGKETVVTYTVEYTW